MSDGNEPGVGATDHKPRSSDASARLRPHCARSHLLPLPLDREREDLKQALQFFYKGEQPTINAILVTQDSLFWTSMQGVLMGIEREPVPGQKRKAWLDPLGNVAMPIGVSPTAYPEHMYYVVMSTDPKIPKGLICYRPAD